MIDWIKPNGVEIRTNDMEETVTYCESLGWKRRADVLAEKDAEIERLKAQVETPKRKRRTKAEMEADKLDSQNQ